MAERTWKAHPFYDGYEASDDGLVRSTPRLVSNRWGGSHWIAGRELKTFLRKGGYRGGNISVAGSRVNFEVHVFVCETFHGARPDAAAQVRHLNGNKLDNHPANLAWGTASENMLDKVLHGTHHEAAKTHCAHGHEFTPENTYRPPGATNKRRCRMCDRATDMRRRRRRRDRRAGVDST